MRLMSSSESLEPTECEVNVKEEQNTTDVAQTTIVDISEIDLSGYNYDLVPTYKMIEDLDDQDTLFRIQFLQAFGINDNEYHPDIVSAIINDLYERYIAHPVIRDIIETHPLYNSQVRSPSDEEDDRSESSPTLLNNSEMIFCMMFSFQLFDLFHTCLRHAKYGEEIPQAIRDEIVECWKTMF